MKNDYSGEIRTLFENLSKFEEDPNIEEFHVDSQNNNLQNDSKKQELSKKLHLINQSLAKGDIALAKKEVQNLIMHIDYLFDKQNEE